MLVIVGDFDTAQAKELVRRYYDPWKAGYQAPDVPVEPPQKDRRDVAVEYEGRSLPILSLNYKGPAWNPNDRSALAIEVLGNVAFGPNSAIYRKLVIDEQRLQFLGAGFSLSRDPGLLTLQGMVSDPSDTDAVRQELLQAVASLSTDLVS